MPWSNQSGGGSSGGGPWGGGGGSGPRGPWGQPPQGGGRNGSGGGGGQPPDLEDFIRRGQDRLKTVFPGGGGLDGKSIAVLVALALGGIAVWNSFFTVQPDQVGIVTRFGAYQAPPRQPGLNAMIWPIEQVQLVPVTRVNQEEIGFRIRGNDRREEQEESLMLTKDENIVSVGFTLSWSIRPDRPQDFLFYIANQREMVRAVAESAMREVVGRNTAEDVITRGQAILQAEVTRIIQEVLDSYRSGIVVNALAVSRPEVPPQVREAFNDVQQAAQDAQTFQNQARRDANQWLADARAEANKLRQDADGWARARTAEAEGEAARFVLVYNEYRNAPDITQRRIFLETMERIFRGTNKVIIEQTPGGGTPVLPYLPLPELRRSNEGPGAAQGASR